jgi:peptide deformylase
VATAEQPSPEQTARREAALGRVRKYGDPVLRERARPVPQVDAAVRRQIAQMRRLLEDAMEAGLAATQLGILNRVFVYRVEPDGPIHALVNPELEWAGAEVEAGEEGCLSIPGIWIEVARPSRVRVQALDEHGEPVVIEADMPEARVLQHELDHLDGVLTLDRTTKDQRRAALRELRNRRA